MITQKMLITNHQAQDQFFSKIQDKKQKEGHWRISYQILICNNILNNQYPMFFLVRNLKTNLLFSPRDMYKLNSQKGIIQMLRDKMQGVCFHQFGYIVKIARDSAYDEIGQQNQQQDAQQKSENSDKKSNNKQGDIGGIDEQKPNENKGEGEEEDKKQKKPKRKLKQFIISTPQIDEWGIKVSIVFSAICFKAQKNDLIQFRVDSISEDTINGRIGPVEITIPSSKLQGFEYKRDQNIFVTRSNQGKIIKVDKGTKIRGMCISCNIEFNSSMKIICVVPKMLLEFIENDYK